MKITMKEEEEVKEEEGIVHNNKNNMWKKIHKTIKAI